MCAGTDRQPCFANMFVLFAQLHVFKNCPTELWRIIVSLHLLSGGCSSNMIQSCTEHALATCHYERMFICCRIAVGSGVFRIFENDERSSDGNYFQILLCSYCELSPLTQITISHQFDCDQKPQTTRVSVKTLLQLYSNFVFEKYLPSLWLPLLTQTPPITHKHIYSDKHRSTTSQHADRWEALFNFLKGNHSISQKAN